MELDEYMQHALRTAPRDFKAYGIPDEVMEALRDHFGDGDGADETALEPVLKKLDQMIWSLGLAGEAGEFADMMKKHHGHGHELDRKKAAKELGDVLWYVAVLANSIGYNLDSIAQMNVQKLKERYPNGFSIERSKDRKEDT